MACRGCSPTSSARRPGSSILQKQDWGPPAASGQDTGPGVRNSAEFFLDTPALRDWLDRGYAPAVETPEFLAWRRR